MTGLGAAPGPEYYLTPGDPVTCLSLRHARLVAGLATGEIVSYDTNTWREQNRQKVFDRGGLLWLDVVELEGARRLVAQGSGYGKKKKRKEILEVHEVPRAEFLIPESYEAEPDCAPAGAISGFTFINFVLSAASVAANLVNNANANNNNNNNNNKWVE